MPDAGEEEYDVDWAGLNFEERRKKRRREDSAAKEEWRKKSRSEVSAAKGKSQNTHTVEKYSVTFPAGSLGLTLSAVLDPELRRVPILRIDTKTKSTKQCSVGDCVCMVNDEPVEAGVPLVDVVRAIVAAKSAEGHFVPVKITFMHRS